ncbi:hypothetical protein ACH4Q7_22425 [Streptomyces roseolus]|uniref:hypothetical protein n=1 Tax=Streptomyces roseolus TaxID=67358 RepID=UPI0037A02230
MTSSYCADCRRPVLWTITAAGRRFAVDPDPDPGGNTAVYRDGTGTRRSRRPSDELPLMSYERLHIPHIATCPGRPAPLPQPRPAVLPQGVADFGAYQRKTKGRS